MAHNDELVLPVGFIRELAAAGSQPELITAVARWIGEVIPVERSSIALPEGTDELQIYAVTEETVLSEGSLLPVDGSLVGRAYASKRMVVVNDLLERDAAESSRLAEAGLRSVLCCPLISGDRCLGTVNLANSRRDYFTERHQVVVRTIADLLASFLSVHHRASSESLRADTDALTGCLNRSAILDHLESAFTLSPRRPSLIYIDFDNFKTVNDLHGHLLGDQVLRILAGRINDAVRDVDATGRLGGDEFLVVVASDEDGHVAPRLANSVVQACRQSITIGAICVEPEVSIGVASVDASTTSADDLLHDADHAMYTIKNTPSSISIADRTSRSRAAMIASIDLDLDRGMNSGEITYHYQPIRDITTRKLRGAEALIRWEHPDLGTIPAALLIERLETTGRTEAFTRWSLNAIASDWRRLRSAVPDLHGVTVSINLTPRQLAWSGYANFHMELLQEHDFSPRAIAVEVVESSEISRGDAAEATLQRLGHHGVSIALDDFGTGHSALGYFTMFPIESIKFDRSLVGVADQNEAARTILAGLASLSHDLGTISVGEGIETEIEARICQQLGITLGQGWHFGRPIPLDALISLARLEADAPRPWRAVALRP